MTPIVFCASLVPCASDTIDAEPIWPIRNPAPRLSARMARVIRYTSQVPMAATSPAMIGDSTAGTITLDTRPCHFTACAGRGQHRADDAADQRVR